MLGWWWSGKRCLGNQNMVFVDLILKTLHGKKQPSKSWQITENMLNLNLKHFDADSDTLSTCSNDLILIYFSIINHDYFKIISNLCDHTGKNREKIMRKRQKMFCLFLQIFLWFLSVQVYIVLITLLWVLVVLIE